jgi:N-methylhydantoinase B
VRSCASSPNSLPTFLGDLRAQIGAAQLGAKRLRELCARYGNETVRAAVDYMVEYAKRRFRAE